MSWFCFILGLPTLFLSFLHFGLEYFPILLDLPTLVPKYHTLGTKSRGSRGAVILFIFESLHLMSSMDLFIPPWRPCCHITPLWIASASLCSLRPPPSHSFLDSLFLPHRIHIAPFRAYASPLHALRSILYTSGFFSLARCSRISFTDAIRIFLRPRTFALVGGSSCFVILRLYPSSLSAHSLPVLDTSIRRIGHISHPGSPCAIYDVFPSYRPLISW